MSDVSQQPLRVLICGGGNGAHVLAGIASSQPNTEARVLTLYQDEAERWTQAMKEGDFIVNLRERNRKLGKITAKPSLVTNDPSLAAVGCSIIALVVPAFAHELYLKALKPYIQPGTAIVGLPGHSGFEFSIRGVLGDIAKVCTLINFESLPWTCRLKTFGREVDVLGTKSELCGSAGYGNTPPPVRDVVANVQRLMGVAPVVKVRGHLLGMTLMGVSSLVHSCILYGQWHSWDGNPVDYPPLFYNGIDTFAANTLSDVSNETMAVAKEIVRQRSVDLSNVSHIYDWYMRCYSDDILDNSDLETSIRTNRAYVGLAHPCQEIDEEKYVPDYSHRYMTEDFPFGLVVMRGIAEIVGVATPNMDKVVEWAEQRTGKQYLMGGRLQGRDVKETRAPQRFGITTLDDLLGLEN